MLTCNLSLFIIVLINIYQIRSHLVVELRSNSSIQQLITSYGFQKYHKIFAQKEFYWLKLTHAQTRQLPQLLRTLVGDTRLSWMDVSKRRSRVLRSIYFNDPYYPQQWYLHNEGQTGNARGNDLNVLSVWEAGFRGDGVVVSVLDDGLQHAHPDIRPNYDPTISYDVVSLDSDDHDPAPAIEPGNSHGTQCAAIIASVANNSICGVGIAHQAQIGGVRLMDGKVSDWQEAIALSYAVDRVDIYSASWGPKDDGRHIAGPGTLAKMAMHLGITQGRGGKGVIYVWAVGNGGSYEDNCNMDGYVSNMYTVAIAALTSDGFSAIYSEGCSSILTSAYVGGLHGSSNSLHAILQDQLAPKVVVPELDGRCSEKFQGTSAASPQVVGAIALALQANPALSWRDVQHVLVRSSRIPNWREHGWSVNGAGRHFHLRYGFGVLDATLLVSTVQTWTPVGRRMRHVVQMTPKKVVCGGNSSVTLSISTSKISQLEHVMVVVSMSHRDRGQLNLFLQSPAGTVSQLLTRRPKDHSRRGLRKWPFLTLHFWDEQPNGRWTFTINDASSTNCQQATGQLHQVTLELYGSKQKTHTGTNNQLRSLDTYLGRAYRPDQKTLRLIHRYERRLAKTTKIHANKIKKSNIIL